jgi:hypothetical protein
LKALKGKKWKDEDVVVDEEEDEISRMVKHRMAIRETKC